jgi:hypothetical protein
MGLTFRFHEYFLAGKTVERRLAEALMKDREDDAGLAGKVAIVSGGGAAGDGSSMPPSTAGAGSTSSTTMLASAAAAASSTRSPRSIDA